MSVSPAVANMLCFKPEAAIFEAFTSNLLVSVLEDSSNVVVGIQSDTTIIKVYLCSLGAAHSGETLHLVMDRATEWYWQNAGTLAANVHAWITLPINWKCNIGDEGFRIICGHLASLPIPSPDIAIIH